MSLETRIRSLEETIRQVLKRDVPPNEESAKNWVILPILKHLGWASIRHRARILL